MEKNILVVNIGSSSKKYAFYHGTKILHHAHFEKSGDGFLVTYDGTQETINELTFDTAIQHFKKRYGITPDIIGLRLVAPGTYFTKDRKVNIEFVGKLKKVASSDLSHIGPVIKEISKIKDNFPGVQIIAVSDSNFHVTMPEIAKNYAISEVTAKTHDIYRFGYHGISVESIVHKMTRKLGKMPEKVVVCHLGSGSSVTALLNGKSVETSMGYSPLEGLVMSERVGDIGVGAVLKLSEISGTDKLLDDFYKSSGLLALSVLSGDMRVLLAAEKKKHKRAHYAVESFIYHVVKQISSSVGVLGGINVLVFSGTIGERSHIIRHRICQRLKWLGIGLVGGSNVECMDCEIISSGAVKVMVYHSDEARVIAQRVIDFV